MDDILKISELRVFAYHGVREAEKISGQNFYLNLEARLDLAKAGKSDDLNLTVNYSEVCHFMAGWMLEHRFDLIEAVCTELCEALLRTYPLMRQVTLEVRKPEAPIGLPVQSVSVIRTLGWHTAYLSLGSNMGDREAHLNEALELLNREPHTRVLKTSRFLKTEPYGYTQQDEFLNAAAKIETWLSPHELLDFLHGIEASRDRERTIHWGPRTLDLDILFYDRLVYEDDTLVIPHADLENRSFVLDPMCEIAPALRHPVSGKTMTQLRKDLGGSGYAPS